MIDWVINNYQWFFSGLGVFLLTSVIGLLIKRQLTKRFTLENIKIGDKTQVNIIHSEGNVKISHPNLKDISSDQILAELLEEKRAERLRLKVELEREEEIYDPQRKKAREYNNKACQLSKEDKYFEAITEIRKAIKIEPEDDLYKRNLTVITINYAISLSLDSGLFDEAITLLEQIKKEGLLNYGYGYWIFGYAYYKKKLYEQAISAYQQAIILEPKNYLHHLYLAEAYFDKGIKDNDLNYQEKALKEIELSLRLNPQEIRSDDFPYPSSAEVILLKTLTFINKGDVEQIKTEYKDFLWRVRLYSSNEIDEIIKEERLSFIIAAITLESFKNKIEEGIGSRVDLDTLMHGVKTIEEIQAMVKEATNKEIPIPALSKLLQLNRFTQYKITQLNEKEKEELKKLWFELVQQFGEKESVVFAKALYKVLKKRKRWIIEDKSICKVA